MIKLFRVAGFSAFIAVMLLNAFVDLGHKILIQNTIFKIHDGETQVVLTAIVNGLILLPFILLFTPAGFISDRFAKPLVMRISAALAVGLTLLITVFYYAGLFWPAFAMTFLLAVQSAIYSPAKYGYIKELVGKSQLGAANGIVQAVTIIAILGGIFAFSILFELRLAGHSYATEGEVLQLVAPAGFILIALSVLELVATFWLVEKPAAAPKQKLALGHYLTGGYLRDNLAAIFAHRSIWLSIVGLSMFWGLSQAVLAIFPAFAKHVTGETDTILIQGAMACSGIGIMLGSVLAGRASRHFIETGLVPIGALGIVACLFVLPLLDNIPAFAINFLALGLFGGLFIIPLNALIQFHAGEGELGRVLAGNNFIQNVVMASFLALTVLTALGGLSMQMLLALLVLIALAGSIYTLLSLPQSLMRYLLRLAVSGRYRLSVIGFRNLPEQGPALILCNHTSLIDWAILQIICPRPIRFLLPREVYAEAPLARVMPLFRVEFLASGGEEAIAAQINAHLKKGELVCLFPEGSPSRTGQLGDFGEGYARAFDGVVGGCLLPVYLGGLWGSRFSHATMRRRKALHTGRRDITAAIGAPLDVAVEGALLKQAVRDLSLVAWRDHACRLPTVPAAWLAQAKRGGRQVVLADASGQVLNGYRALTGALLLSRHMAGLGKAQKIGLLLPPSNAGALANMAVLMSGHVAVNLNYTAPLAALQSALTQAQIGHVYTSRLFLRRLQQRGMDVSAIAQDVQLHFLEDLSTQTPGLTKLALLGCVTLLPAPVLRALFCRAQEREAPAVILFSSGSEGAPKGVVLSHRNLMANIAQVAHVLDIRDDDVMVMSLPLFHAFGLTVTCLLPLVEGFPVAAHPDASDAAGLGRTVARYRGTILCGTSTLFRLYSRAAKLHPLMFDSLRLVVAGAEKLSPLVGEAFAQKFGKSILEGYGTTETAPVASVNVPDALDTVFWRVQVGNRPGTVGMPLPGTNFRITDPDSLEELPIGESGMVFIGGPQVMQGYLDLPEKTDDVLFEVEGATWYKTGDKGHLDRDGFLVLIDRYSRFAKIGGEMVSLGAVEEQVRRVTGDAALDLVAINVPDARKGERVVLLLAEPHADIAADLLEKLRAANVGAHLVPSEVCVVAEIPKLGSGKVDFRAARSLYLADRAAEGGAAGA